MRLRKKAPAQPMPRLTLWDSLDEEASRNLYCRLQDLSNEASVETFFIARLLEDLGYADAQIKTKASIQSLTVAKGHRKEKYKPDYVLVDDALPRCVIDAKATTEDLDKWVEQCSGYCLALNRKHKDSNPVRFFVLSNGIATQVYEWDSDEPILSLEFADFEYGNPKYERLKDVLHAKSIATADVPTSAMPQTDFALLRPNSEQARHLFTACHRIIWKSEGFGPSPAFMEFVKVMFVKMWTDSKLRKNDATKGYFKAANPTTNLPREAVIFSVKWIEDREAEGIASPIDSMLFEQLQEDLELKIQLRQKKRLFNKGERIRLKPHTIKEVVRRLEHFDMFGIDEDLNGRLFETFLSATMRGRELGQFFTPRSVVKMMTKLADLQVTRKHQDKVLDACCGSGGFLIEALTMMRNSIRENLSFTQEEKEHYIKEVANNCLYGIDYGKDPPLARIARINMYLHGDGGSRIYYADALDKRLEVEHDNDPEIIQDLQELRETLSSPLQVDVILTNPPFSMTKESRNDAEKIVLERYELAKRDQTSAALRPSLRSSIMFIERYWELLRPGGRLITVIDDTLLASGQDVFASIRNYIRDKFIIRAIISLPGDTFRRSGARVKTSVLVLEKKRNPKDTQPSCFTFFSECIGVDDLTPRASESDIQEARSKAEQETDAILSGYKAYLSGAKGAHLLSPELIQDRLDLKYCFPQFGRLADDWESRGIDVKPLSECVEISPDVVIPFENPDAEFTLIKVTYAGRCEVDKTKLGRAIKAPIMYRVLQGQMVFSTIRATDGAIGIVPEEMDGALVSGSYTVFDCNSPEETAYLWAILRSHEIRADMQSLSPGSGRYTTPWPEVGCVLIPWHHDRKKIGKDLIAAWKMEKKVEAMRQSALSQVEGLGVESSDSIQRFRASKAPT